MDKSRRKNTSIAPSQGINLQQNDVGGEIIKKKLLIKNTAVDFIRNYT
jgi:hypothetical protein